MTGLCAGLSVTSNTRHGPDESFIDVENENFR